MKTKNNQKPILSNYFKERMPSSIRLAQIEFEKRNENIDVINAAIGNVSLPMHPKMQERMFNLYSDKSPFKNGVVKYSTTKGLEETRLAFIKIIKSFGFNVDNLKSIITDGASQSMELMIVGTCESNKPLLTINPVYTNYLTLAERLNINTVTMNRLLMKNGKFEEINIEKLEKIIIKEKPGSLLIIPYDNPTGNLITQDTIIKLGKLCVKYNIWFVSDETYRGLSYNKAKISSIWNLDEQSVPGITQRRISLESSSKIWNACGLRIGSIITDNDEFYNKALNDYTSNLCSNVIGQYIFGAIAHESNISIKKWHNKQTNYYKKIIKDTVKKFYELMPNLIISEPESSIYSIIDVENIVNHKFNSVDFILHCAKNGKVDINNKLYTILLAPMLGFYKLNDNSNNPGRTQFRLAYVENYERMLLLPLIFKKLLYEYIERYKFKK